MFGHGDWAHEEHTDAGTVGSGAVLLQDNSQVKTTHHWVHEKWSEEKSCVFEHEWKHTQEAWSEHRQASGIGWRQNGLSQKETTVP